jgi:hypothetical protein
MILRKSNAKDKFVIGDCIERLFGGSGTKTAAGNESRRR